MQKTNFISLWCIRALPDLFLKSRKGFPQKSEKIECDTNANFFTDIPLVFKNNTITWKHLHSRNFPDAIIPRWKSSHQKQKKTKKTKKKRFLCNSCQLCLATFILLSSEMVIKLVATVFLCFVLKNLITVIKQWKNKLSPFHQNYLHSIYLAVQNLK